MESKYLKESLDKLAGLKARAEQIQSPENRAAIKAQNAGGLTDGVYPTMCGELSGIILLASCAIAAAQHSAERLEAIEREHERFVSIFEALDIEFDETALATLELIGKRTWAEGYKPLVENSLYRDERRAISNAISRAIADVQESEREFEHEKATEAIAAAGFVRFEDDSFDGWARDIDNIERISINMSYKNRITVYSWELERDGVTVDSGKSGEFSRLIALIAPKPICGTCDGKGFVNPDGTANNAFEGPDSDPTISCPACGVATAVASCNANIDAGIQAYLTSTFLSAYAVMEGEATMPQSEAVAPGQSDPACGGELANSPCHSEVKA